MTIALFVQSLAQLDARYGVAGRKEILDCCSYKALLSVTEPDEQDYFSRLIGTTMKPQVSLSEDGTGRVYQEARQRIVEPEDLGKVMSDYFLLAPWGPNCILRGYYHNSDRPSSYIKHYEQ